VVVVVLVDILVLVAQAEMDLIHQPIQEAQDRAVVAVAVLVGGTQPQVVMVMVAEVVAQDYLA
jgi:hypothetical protein